jgi:hypothetical protein
MRASIAAIVLAGALAVGGAPGLASARTGAAVGSQAAGRAVPSRPGWQLTYTLPLVDYQSVWVKSIVALGSADAWAVGGEMAVVRGQATGVPAIIHWNGSRWAFSRLPGPQHLDYFSTVVASSPDDVWAFGGEGASSDSAPYIAHWNGSRWRWVRGSGPGAVLAAADLGPSDVWVSGYEANQVRNWNGHHWKTYVVPGSGIDALAGSGSHDVWAIGTAGLQFEALRWTGRRWQAVPIPPVVLPPDGQAYPLAAASAGTGTAWAVGVVGYLDPGTQLENSRPVAYRWDGHGWQDLAVPLRLYDGFAQGADFTQVAPDGKGGFWAVMQAGSLVERLVHYRRGTWTSIALPAIKGSAGFPVPPAIIGLAAIPRTDELWAPVTYQNIRPAEYRYGMYRYRL